MSAPSDGLLKVATGVVVDGSAQPAANPTQQAIEIKLIRTSRRFIQAPASAPFSSPALLGAYNRLLKLSREPLPGRGLAVSNWLTLVVLEARNRVRAIDLTERPAGRWA